MDGAGEAGVGSTASSGTMPEALTTKVGKLELGAAGDVVTHCDVPDSPDAPHPDLQDMPDLPDVPDSSPNSSPEPGTTPETGAAAATAGTGCMLWLH